MDLALLCGLTFSSFFPWEVWGSAESWDGREQGSEVAVRGSPCVRLAVSPGVICLFHSCDFSAPCSHDRQLKCVVLCSRLHLEEQKCPGYVTAVGISTCGHSGWKQMLSPVKIPAKIPAVSHWRHHFTLWKSPRPLLSCWQQCLRTRGESDTHKPDETSPLLTGNFLYPVIFSGTALVGVKLNKLKSHLLPPRCRMQPGANCSVLQNAACCSLDLTVRFFSTCNR